MYVDCNPLLYRDRAVHTPASVRQGLRLGTMTAAQARGHLASWGESERDIQLALESGGWAETTAGGDGAGPAVPGIRSARE
jgi:hypothetical protein